MGMARTPLLTRIAEYITATQFSWEMNDPHQTMIYLEVSFVTLTVVLLVVIWSRGGVDMNVAMEGSVTGLDGVLPNSQSSCDRSW